MHSLSLLTIAQLVLIVVGLIFQVVALSWLFRDSSGERSDGEHDGWGDRKFEISLRRRPAGHGHHHHHGPPRGEVRDYYDIEKTPPGVRPADLRKTARVIYMDNAVVPRTEAHGEAQT
jgi:hypothetical protein